MHPVNTGFPLCSPQLYIAVGVSAAGLSVRSSAAGQREVCVLVKDSGAMLLALPRQVDFFYGAIIKTWPANLMAAITLVRLLSAVHPLVSVQVVALNEAHITCITGKWLFSCKSQREHFNQSRLSAYFD